MFRFVGLVVTFCLSVALAMTGVGRSGQRPSSDFVGNDACVPCHKSIVESYAATAMGRTSGPAPAGDCRGFVS